MKTLAHASPFSLLFAGAVVGLAAAFACSSSSNPGATGSLECTSLASCCLAMGSAAAIGECNAIVATGVEATCTSSLISYTTTGACTVGTGPADAGHVFGFDSGIPCQTTGTCTPTKDGGHVSGFDAGASTVCSGAVACSNGQTYEQCESTATGACTAEVVFSGGATFACTSCADCTSALALAASKCGTTTTTDAGGGTDAGSGTDAGACGTAPVLHPETAAGVYCPFAAGGSPSTAPRGRSAAKRRARAPTGRPARRRAPPAPSPGRSSGSATARSIARGARTAPSAAAT